jgi:signal transduction histidine kinase
MINACVSHELRNPLNSIIAKNLEKEALYQQLKDQLGMFEGKIKESDTYKEFLDTLN